MFFDAIRDFKLRGTECCPCLWSDGSSTCDLSTHRLIDISTSYTLLLNSDRKPNVLARLKRCNKLGKEIEMNKTLVSQTNQYKLVTKPPSTLLVNRCSASLMFKKLTGNIIVYSVACDENRGGPANRKHHGTNAALALCALRAFCVHLPISKQKDQNCKELLPLSHLQVQNKRHRNEQEP
jgi:hypothetical protein